MDQRGGIAGISWRGSGKSGLALRTGRTYGWFYARTAQAVRAMLEELS